MVINMVIKISYFYLMYKWCYCNFYCKHWHTVDMNELLQCMNYKTNICNIIFIKFHSSDEQ